MSGVILSDRLHEACAEFEAAMLRYVASAAGIGRTARAEDAGDDTAAGAGIAGLSDLFAEALARAVERAGGVGVAERLARALEQRRP